MNRIRCQRCRDRGFLRNPCPECGAIRFRQAGGDVVAYEAGSIWGDDRPAPVPKDRRARAHR